MLSFNGCTIALFSGPARLGMGYTHFVRSGYPANAAVC